MTYRPESTPAVDWARRAAIAAGALIITIAIIAGFVLTAHTLALLFAAVIIGEAVDPIVERLARRMPKGLAVILLFLALIAVLSALVWFISPQVTEQGQELVDALPKSSEEAQQRLEELGISADTDVWTVIQDNVGQFTGALVSIPVAIVSSLAEVVLITFMAAYWLLARGPLWDFFRSLVPGDRRDSVDHVLNSMSQTVGGYVRGVGVGALIIGVCVYIGLLVIGVPYAAVLAILAAFGEVIPIVGPIITAVPAVIIAFLETPTLALIVIVFYLVLQQIESNLIVPNVMSQQADIPPVLVIAAISAGGGIGGILGAIIAIPLVGAIRVLILQVAAPGIRHWTGADAPADNDEKEHAAAAE